jgi:hypothetical protein
MVAFITGLADPVHGSDAHAAAMRQLLCSFPICTSVPPTQSNSAVATGSRS